MPPWDAANVPFGPRACQAGGWDAAGPDDTVPAMSDAPGTVVRPPAVVLVRPQEEGNVGAAARAMANMGLSELILVEPAVALGRVARAFAVKAGSILEAARRVPSLEEALAPFRRVVGTTSSRARVPAAPIVEPREAAARLGREAPGLPTALVFGPETSGLTTDELALCGLLVRVPCAPIQPTLNLAQAVLIVAYELYLARPEVQAPADAPASELPAPTAEIEALFRHGEGVLEGVGFARDDTFQGVLRDLRRLAARSGLTSREVAILHGVCRRTRHALARTGGERGTGRTEEGAGETGRIGDPPGG